MNIYEAARAAASISLLDMLPRITPGRWVVGNRGDEVIVYNEAGTVVASFGRYSETWPSNHIENAVFCAGLRNSIEKTLQLLEVAQTEATTARDEAGALKARHHAALERVEAGVDWETETIARLMDACLDTMGVTEQGERPAAEFAAKLLDLLADDAETRRMTRELRSILSDPASDGDDS